MKRNLCSVESHEEMIDDHRNIVGGQEKHQHHLERNFNIITSFRNYVRPDICPGCPACPGQSLVWGEAEGAQSQERESSNSSWMIEILALLQLSLSREITFYRLFILFLAGCKLDTCYILIPHYNSVIVSLNCRWFPTAIPSSQLTITILFDCCHCNSHHCGGDLK